MATSNLASVPTSNPDFLVENYGSISLLRPMTLEGDHWIEANLPYESIQFTGAVVVEHRYITNILQGITEDGLEVSRG